MQKYSVSEEKLALGIFLFVIGFIGCYWYFAFDGFYFFDDVAYSRYAWDVTQGSFTINQNDTFAHRLGVFIPVAIIYSVAGISDYATILWPLLAFVSTAFIVFFQLRKYSTSIALFAVVVASLNFYPIFFSNKLYPDSIVAFFTTAAAFVVWKVITSSTIKIFFHALVFCLLLFAAFVTKETITFYAPFYLLVFVIDIIKKRNTKFWVYSLGIGIVLLITYFTIYYLKTGDAFYRFKVIQEGHYSFAMSYYDKSFREIIPRLTYEPFIMFINSEMAIPLVLAFPLLFSIRKKDFINLSEFESFWKVLCLILLVMLWFCSTSFKFYNPLSLQPRMYLLLIPTLSIVAATALVKADKGRIIFYGILFAVCAGISYYFHFSSMLVYALLTGYFILRIYFNNSSLSFKIIPLLFILLIHPVYSMIKPSDTDYKNEKEIVTKFLMDNKGNNLVLVDDQLLSGYPYYYKFVKNSHYQYQGYKKDIPANFEGTIFVLVNKKTFVNLAERPPMFAIQEPEQWQKIFQKGNVILYRVNSKEDFERYKSNNE